MASDYRLSLSVKVFYVKFVLGVPHLLGVSLGACKIDDVCLGLRALGFDIVLFVEICARGVVHRRTTLGR